MSEGDIQLLLTAFGGVALLVTLIVTRIRMHPLIALLVVSLAVGLVAGMDIESIAGATVTGAGHATMATGCTPDQHGIIDNDWYDRAAAKAVSETTTAKATNSARAR